MASIFVSLTYAEQFGHRFLRQAARLQKLREVQILGETLRLRLNPSSGLRLRATPAGVNAGFAVETARRQGSDVIQSTIVNELRDADLVSADLMDDNPNVSFELGLRMAEEKPVALIKTSDTGRIFDVDNMLRVMEDNANPWPSTIEIDVPLMTEQIKAAWEARASEGCSVMGIPAQIHPATVD